MKRMAICTALCLLLCGCELLPYPRELEDTMLVRVLGVDWTDEGVTLTAADVPEGGEQTAGEVLTAAGSTLEESRQTLKEQGEEYVALTHVTQLVVGAESDLRAVLEAALAQREIGQTATVWLAQDGPAKELLEQVGGGAKRLTSLELNADELEARTVLDALAQLEQDGQVALPALTVANGALEAAGMTVWKEEGP